jgi:hypothetical protein
MSADIGVERSFQLAEIREAQRRSQELRARLHGGDDSPVLRVRIEGLERLLLALGGVPDVLAGHSG